ncbi:HAD family hydrolase [Streptomyces sp. NRRL F-2890]|uniref:HAD family hydrolase n=1 Tax=Streptomyces sp. NRRL F-2890 TaxID=1463845 RepID=UPI000AEE652B|nr:HAD-IA family hydrolase [Streptomyces sp. NRRL F-2890]
MQTEAIVFDFDGLLMDTETTLLECWQYEWRQHGLELDPDTFFADHGGDITAEHYRRLAAAVGPGFDYKTSHTRRLAHREELHSRLGLRDGIDAWLTQARDAGLRCAVASSSTEEWVTSMLARVDRLDTFAVLAFGDEVPAPKPAPDVYMLALDRLGLDPAQAIAVEDTPHGAAAAQAAGLSCIAIPNPFADLTHFTAADLVLTTAAELPLQDAIKALTGTAPQHSPDPSIHKY